jgi:hypothetical protein
LADHKSHFRVSRKFFNVRIASGPAFAEIRAHRRSGRQSKAKRSGRACLAAASLDLPIPSERRGGTIAAFDRYESADMDDFVGKGDERPLIYQLCHKFDRSQPDFVSAVQDRH